MKIKPNPDITGQRFGRLLALSWSKTPKQHGFVWTCRCDCGCSVDIRADGLKSGRAKSCGCLKRDLLVSRQTKHGASRTLTYSTWRSMLARCNDPENDNYPHYGGRGIKVCAEWLDFHAFLNAVGTRPSKFHTLDRKNNSGNYEPGNVRWATCIEQGNNRRTNRIVTLGGKTMSATLAARRVGMKPMTLLGRLKDGWGFERAITEPVRLATNPSGVNGSQSSAAQ